MHDPAQDFEAAADEIRSNLDVRRLLFVLINLLVPGLIVAATDFVAGTTWPEPLRDLPRHVPRALGVLLTATSVLVTVMLARCHLGMVVNGSKIGKVRSGALRLAGLNWLGVTTNFVLVTALSAAGGLWLTLHAFGQGTLALPAALGLLLLLIVMLRLQHWRANRLARKLDAHWQHGDLPLPAVESHRQDSLSATTSDISVVVSMEAALFVGLLAAMANFGTVADGVVLGLPAAEVQRRGFPLVSGYLLLLLLLCQRMVVRLRLALAEHSAALSALRGEPDDPWRFSPLERTFLLYSTGALFVAAAAALLLATLAASELVWLIAAGVLLLSLLHYPASLARGRRRAAP